MKTTLNIPDAVVAQAKKRAAAEGTTLTDILVQGLKARLEKSKPDRVLPISTASGGLKKGLRWDKLEAAEPEEELYR
jgi:hypothetical protein